MPNPHSPDRSTRQAGPGFGLTALLADLLQLASAANRHTPASR
jgi:hypothetical protein